MGDLIKYAKAYAIAAMVGKGAAVVAIALPVVAMVCAGGGELHLTWRLGA